MTDRAIVGNDHDFGALHTAMQRYVDQEILAGVSSAVLVGVIWLMSIVRAWRIVKMVSL